MTPEPGCLVRFGTYRELEVTPAAARALAELDDVVVHGFYFDCIAGISGDVLLADGRRVTRDGAVIDPARQRTSR